MKKIIMFVGFVMLVGVISGCGKVVQNNNNVQENKTDYSNTREEVSAKDINKTPVGEDEQTTVDELKSENIEEVLGDNNVSEKEVADGNAQKKDTKECDEGFVFNTELNECFKLGASADKQDVEAKIDPVVKNCIDKGGIYNAQVEKCFIQ